MSSGWSPQQAKGWKRKKKKRQENRDSENEETGRQENKTKQESSSATTSGGAEKKKKKREAGQFIAHLTGIISDSPEERQKQTSQKQKQCRKAIRRLETSHQSCCCKPRASRKNGPLAWPIFPHFISISSYFSVPPSLPAEHEKKNSAQSSFTKPVYKQPSIHTQKQFHPFAIDS